VKTPQHRKKRVEKKAVSVTTQYAIKKNLHSTIPQHTPNLNPRHTPAHSQRAFTFFTECCRTMFPFSTEFFRASTGGWQRLLRQYLYFCTSKASKLSTGRGVSCAGVSQSEAILAICAFRIQSNAILFVCSILYVCTSQYSYFCTSKASKF